MLLEDKVPSQTGGELVHSMLAPVSVTGFVQK